MSNTNSGTSTSATMVPNPMHEALARLYSKLQGDAATMSNALKPANQQMAAGGTWVGTPAKSWGSQLDGHSGDCATQVNAMLADVSQALAAEPAQVTTTEAQEKAKLMSMMERGY
jgi:hypothetical protein